jgi:undecaprenyl-diphosphatase
MPEASDSAARARLVLQLRLGAVVFVASALLFGLIAEDVVSGDRLTLLDVRVAEWLHLHASTGMTRSMLLVSQLHSTVAMTVYTLAIGVLAFKRQQWRRILTLALCMGGGLLLNVLMKLAFHRARPQFADPIITLSSYSFPSGHVAASTIFYTLGVVWVFGRTPAVHWRLLAVIGAALAILLVAFSRMYLGVHYLSDVAAAFAEGIAWLTLCLVALDAFWRRPHPAPLASDA